MVQTKVLFSWIAWATAPIHHLPLLHSLHTRALQTCKESRDSKIGSFVHPSCHATMGCSHTCQTLVVWSNFSMRWSTSLQVGSCWCMPYEPLLSYCMTEHCTKFTCTKYIKWVAVYVSSDHRYLASFALAVSWMWLRTLKMISSNWSTLYINVNHLSCRSTAPNPHVNTWSNLSNLECKIHYIWPQVYGMVLAIVHGLYLLMMQL